MHQRQVSKLASPSSSAWKELSLAFADERLSNACTEAFENSVLLLRGFSNGVCLSHNYWKVACLVHYSLCFYLKGHQLIEAVTISLCCLNIVGFADLVIHGHVAQKFQRKSLKKTQIKDVDCLCFSQSQCRFSKFTTWFVVCLLTFCSIPLKLHWSTIVHRGWCRNWLKMQTGPIILYDIKGFPVIN